MLRAEADGDTVIAVRTSPTAEVVDLGYIAGDPEFVEEWLEELAEDLRSTTRLIDRTLCDRLQTTRLRNPSARSLYVDPGLWESTHGADLIRTQRSGDRIGVCWLDDIEIVNRYSPTR